MYLCIQSKFVIFNIFFLRGFLFLLVVVLYPRKGYFWFLNGGSRGARSFWCNVGVTGQRSEKTQDFYLLYRRMHTVHACSPPTPSRVYILYLSHRSSPTNTHTHTPLTHELSAQTLPVFSEWCLCVVQACSWAVYIHGESHLGGSQTVCLWLCLPLVT